MSANTQPIVLTNNVIEYLLAQVGEYVRGGATPRAALQVQLAEDLVRTGHAGSNDIAMVLADLAITWMLEAKVLQPVKITLEGTDYFPLARGTQFGLVIVGVDDVLLPELAGMSTG